MARASRYGLTAIVLHWVSAICVLGLFGLGFWMVDLDYYSKWYQTAPHWHMSIGILIALVTMVRYLWRWLKPVRTGEGSPLEQKAGHAAHVTMYLMLACLFITGYLIPTGDGRGIEVFDWFVVPSIGTLFADQKEIAGLVHEYVAYALIALVTLHAVAALKHHFINKDSTLEKMLKP